MYIIEYIYYDKTGIGAFGQEAVHEAHGEQRDPLFRNLPNVAMRFDRVGWRQGRQKERGTEREMKREKASSATPASATCTRLKLCNTVYFKKKCTTFVDQAQV